MTIYPETRDSLIVQVKDRNNGEAWELFSQIYRPVIYRIARNRGLQDADAHDLAQQVLINVARAIGQWNKADESTKFRHWLSRVVRNALLNALTRLPRDLSSGGTSSNRSLAEIADSDNEIDAQIENEYRRELYLRASDTVKASVELSTWNAFEQTVLHGREISDVAQSLGLSAGAVYTARSRVMMRLQEEVRTLQEQT